MEEDIEEKRIKEKMFRKIIKKLEEKEERIYEANDENFEELVVEKSFEKPVLVDFYADWCYPCRILSPILDKIVESDKRFVLVKVNVDNSPRTAEEFGIMSIPTVILFKNGKPINYFVGALHESQIIKWLDKNLGELNE